MSQNGTPPFVQGAAPAFERLRVQGGLLLTRRIRSRGRLIQIIALHRDDGSVWPAYERRVLLPPDRLGAERLAREAELVLSLARAAILATDLARMGRSGMRGGASLRRWVAGARRGFRRAMSRVGFRIA